MSPKWIDIHAHLDHLEDPDLAKTLTAAADADVSTIISTATDLASAATVVRQCQSFPGLYGAAGISPFDASALPADWENALRGLLRNERIIAVGEIGIDNTNPRYPPLAVQLPVFEKQLAIARESGLPAVIHSRGTERRAAEICHAAGMTGCVFHCFTGERESLELLLDFGYYASFSGIITFSETVRTLLSIVPLDRIFIETDTPYLAPVPHRGKPNCPANVRLVGETVALFKGIQPEELQETIADNFARVFLRKDP